MVVACFLVDAAWTREDEVVHVAIFLADAAAPLICLSFLFFRASVYFSSSDTWPFVSPREGPKQAEAWWGVNGVSGRVERERQR